MSDQGDLRQANRLIAAIREYWIDHGHPGIQAWVEPMMLTDKIQSRTVYVIRSNIGSAGYPPKTALATRKIPIRAY